MPASRKMTARSDSRLLRTISSAANEARPPSVTGAQAVCSSTKLPSLCP